jgi:cysteine desulfurase
MIYFDHAATTPVCAEAREAALRCMNEVFGNPSSPHHAGLAAERAVKAAARDLAEMLGVGEEEIIFTSGGTESNNLAIFGAVAAMRGHRDICLNVVTSKHMHASVAEPLRVLAERGAVRLSYDMSACDLLCLTQVCHETGDMPDIERLVQEAKRLNPAVKIFMDGAQGFGKHTLSLKHIDLYAFSGHKIHGIKGAGGLAARKTRLLPLMYGGGQQYGLRPGTENVPALCAMAAAARTPRVGVGDIYRIIAALAVGLPDTLINRQGEAFSPYILNMSFMGVRGEILVNALSERGVCVSTGAACHAGRKGAAPLETMGFSRDRAASAVRFSFSYMNTEAEARAAVEIVKDCVRALRKGK